MTQSLLRTDIKLITSIMTLGIFISSKIAIVIISLGFLFCLLSSVASAAPTWHMVNCNTSSQGDCHLLEDNAVYTLIDAGKPDIATKTLVPYLLLRNIDEIDHFFISHPHTDHYGGLESLKTAGIKVKNIYYNPLPSDVSDFDYKPELFYSLLSNYEDSGTRLHDVRAGFHLNLPSSKIFVLEAKKERQGDVNDYSIQMVWDAGGYRVLFTGDLNSKLGSELANREEFKADILKIPHHGVTGIAPNKFFDNVAPSLLMIPGNKDLWFNPRGTQLREWAIKSWKEKNTHFCSNGFNGDVKISFH